MTKGEGRQREERPAGSAEAFQPAGMVFDQTEWGSTCSPVPPAAKEAVRSTCVNAEDQCSARQPGAAVSTKATPDPEHSSAWLISACACVLSARPTASCSSSRTTSSALV